MREIRPTPAAKQDLSFPTHDEWSLIARRLRLSGRESEVARLTLEDLDEADIASSLRIAPRTVRAHLEHAYRKMAVHNRCQFAMRVFREYVQLTAERSAAPPIG
jgi:DNA-binding CsgD family transcriptional regulator